MEWGREIRSASQKQRYHALQRVFTGGDSVSSFYPSPEVGRVTRDTSMPCQPEWYLRRPLFWWALTAVGGSFAAAAPVGAWFWPALLAVAFTMAALRRWYLVALTLAALVFGLAASHSLTGSRNSALHDGDPQTLRGVVTERRTSGITLLQAEWRRSPSGWAPERGRYTFFTEQPLAAGAELELSGTLEEPPPATNPGNPSRRLEDARAGVGFHIHLRAHGLTVTGRRPLPPGEAVGLQLRRAILEANRRTLEPRAAIIANDFLIGDSDPPDAALGQQVQEQFRDAGTIHLLVVSGTQVTLVLAAFIWLGWRFYRIRHAMWLLGLAALAVFYLTTNGAASVTRAAVMGIVCMGGLALSREPDGENCLGIAALILLALQPLAAFDLGAQLSFVALWALLRLSPALEQALRPASTENPAAEIRHTPALRMRSGAAALASATVAAHLGVAPLLAYHFQRGNWGGLLANLVMLPLAGLFTYLAALHALLAQLGWAILAFPVNSLAAVLHQCAAYFARPPLGSADVFPPPLWLVLLCLALLAVPSAHATSRGLAFATVAAVAALLALSERAPAAPPADPVFRAIDVGQGDALLLEDPTGTHILVDAGPPAQGRVLVRTLRALRVGVLDAVLVSHPHADHIGGLTTLLPAIPVRTLIHNVESGPPDWEKVLHLARRWGVPELHAAAGERFDRGASHLLFLGPSRAHGQSSHERNEESLVTAWQCAGRQVLLTGDTEKQAEGELLSWGSGLQSDILKVAHHGSRSATDMPLLELVRPRGALISCGRHNRFGHPTRETLEHLRSAGVPVYRTDRDGMVTFRLGPRHVDVEIFATGN